MEKQELDGLVKTYNGDGSLLAETTYLMGIRHGPYRDHWRNGRVSLEGQFVNGLKEVGGTSMARTAVFARSYSTHTVGK